MASEDPVRDAPPNEGWGLGRVPQISLSANRAALAPPYQLFHRPAHGPMDDNNRQYDQYPWLRIQVSQLSMLRLLPW